jgi:hypothetical protein
VTLVTVRVEPGSPFIAKRRAVFDEVQPHPSSDPTLTRYSVLVLLADWTGDTVTMPATGPQVELLTLVN